MRRISPRLGQALPRSKHPPGAPRSSEPAHLEERKKKKNFCKVDDERQNKSLIKLLLTFPPPFSLFSDLPLSLFLCKPPSYLPPTTSHNELWENYPFFFSLICLHPPHLREKKRTLSALFVVSLSRSVSLGCTTPAGLAETFQKNCPPPPIFFFLLRLPNSPHKVKTTTSLQYIRNVSTLQSMLSQGSGVREHQWKYLQTTEARRFQGGGSCVSKQNIGFLSLKKGGGGSLCFTV